MSRNGQSVTIRTGAIPCVIAKKLSAYLLAATNFSNQPYPTFIQKDFFKAKFASYNFLNHDTSLRFGKYKNLYL